MVFNSNNLNNFRKDFSEAMKTLEVKYNVTVSLGKISYSDVSATGKCTIANKASVNGLELNAEDVENWNLYSEMFGLKREWLGKTFNYDGATNTIIGIEPSRRKYPVKVLKNGGGISLYTVESIKALLKN